MNTIDFIRETAIYMSNDRPDIYDMETAVDELSIAMDSLREEADTAFVTVTFTSYMLSRIWDGTSEEFIFARKVSGLAICEAEEDVRAFAYDYDVDLPNILDGPIDEDGTI